MSSTSYGFKIYSTIFLGAFILLANLVTVPILKRAKLGVSRVTAFLLIHLAYSDMLLGTAHVIRGIFFLLGGTSFYGCLGISCLLNFGTHSTFCSVLISSVYNFYNCQGKVSYFAII